MHAGCPDEGLLLGLVQGRLADLFARSVRQHLDRCSHCQAVVAEAMRSARAGANVDEPRRPTENQCLGDDYRLVSLLGRGGVGSVWSVVRITDQRRFAAKLLHVEGEAVMRRFLREARIGQLMTHPNLVRIHEIVDSGPLAPALIMDLLEGEDLAARRRRLGPSTPADAAVVLVPIVDALIALHARQIAHRDLKPSNIFLHDAAQGIEPKLLDFGMARLLDAQLATVAESRLTGPGTALGTPRYMAPEQLRGEQDVDPRADIWALGATLYELLATRSHVLETRFQDVLGRVLTAAIDPIRRHAPGLPAELAIMIDSALDRDRNARPTAVAMRSTLSRLLGSS